MQKQWGLAVVNPKLMIKQQDTRYMKNSGRWIQLIEILTTELTRNSCGLVGNEEWRRMKTHSKY